MLDRTLINARAHDDIVIFGGHFDIREGVSRTATTGASRPSLASGADAHKFVEPSGTARSTRSQQAVSTSMNAWTCECGRSKVTNELAGLGGASRLIVSPNPALISLRDADISIPSLDGVQ